MRSRQLAAWSCAAPYAVVPLPIDPRAPCAWSIPWLISEWASRAPTAAGMDRTIASVIRPKVHRRTRRRAGADRVRTAPTRHGPVAATATSAVAPWKATGGQRNTTCTARAPVSAPRSTLGRRGHTPAKASKSAASAGSTSQPRLIATASTPSHSSVPRGARAAAQVTAAANAAA